MHQNENTIKRYYELNETTYKILASQVNSETSFSDIINKLILTFLNLPDSFTNMLTETLYKTYWSRHQLREKKRRRLSEGDTLRTEEFLDLDKQCIHYAGLLLFYGKDNTYSNGRWPVHEIDFSRSRHSFTGESHTRLFPTKTKSTRCHIDLTYQAAALLDRFQDLSEANHPSDIINALIVLMYTLPKDCQLTLLSFMRNYGILIDQNSNETCYYIWKFIKETYKTEERNGKPLPFPRNETEPIRKKRRKSENKEPESNE